MNPLVAAVLTASLCVNVFAQTQPPAGKIDAQWAKPHPVSSTVQEADGACPAEGKGGDTATNQLKNRTDLLPPPHDVTWAAINSLAFPNADASRLKWTTDQLNQIKPFEGVAIRVVAYLSHQIKIETEGKGESTNCYFIQPAEVDWHMYLTNQPNQPIKNAVIVETTPRIRATHRWDEKSLSKWVNSQKPVRISGFLMLDPEHRDVVGSERSTVWEIHPVMKIEVCNTTVCRENEWADLDSIQPAAGRAGR